MEDNSLNKVKAADRTIRRLSLLFFVLVLAVASFQLFTIQNNINRKIDGLVQGSIERGNNRQIESKTIAKETTRYTTCIFVIPIEQRTPENQEKCFEASDLDGGLTRDDFSPFVIDVDGTISPSNFIERQSENTRAQAVPQRSIVASAQPSPQPAIIVQNNPTPNTTQASNQTEESTPTPNSPNLIQRITNPLTNLINTIIP